MKNLLIVGILFLIASCASRQSETPDIKLESQEPKLGTVNFPVSCTKEASEHITRGVALLHHMTYGGSRQAFETATSLDPECAMGFWGQAMTGIHPLWSDKPSEQVFDTGKKQIDKALNTGNKTTRETDYIKATHAYYVPGWTADEKANLQAFEKGWEKVYLKYPGDLEARSFYALAHLANADPQDKTYERQLATGGLMERVLTEVPDHPGAHHYTIHAYDYPPLAEKALEVSYSYGNIAPDVPHALHMPTHIFTRLGLWDDSIEMNNRSADAALKYPANGAISLHYLHALDYLAYAYLQKGQDLKAKEILNTINSLEDSIQNHVASSYTLASVSARIALERHDWEAASQVSATMPDSYPLGNYPAMLAVTHFARALGAANTGNGELAEKEIATLEDLKNKEAESSAYWAKQVEIQMLSAIAWLTYNQGYQTQGLNVMKKAADLESSTEKHPITPGEILPARELLADMLFVSKDYAKALKEYENALMRSPNRLNSLYGAGRSAELYGDSDKASYYYEKLVELTIDANNTMEQVEQAKAYLAQN